MDNKITAIQPQKKNQKRLNVFINDEFAFGISRYVGHSLVIGQKLDHDQIERLTGADEREKAYQRALRYISYKPRTEFEVREKLRESGFEEITIELVIEEMIGKNYLNDRDFASEWIAIRSVSKPRSRRQLSFELHKKGISADIIQEEIDHAPEDIKSAIKLGRKYINRYSRLDERDYQKKMFGVLARRAFPFEVIKTAIDELSKERLKFDQRM